MGNDHQTRKNAGEALESLHKGLGVRHRDLYHRLGPALRGIWGITSADAASVREQTTTRLEQSLTGLGDPDLVKIAKVSYNIDPDPRFTRLNYGMRVEELAAWLGNRRGFSPRNIERRRSEVIQHVQARLDSLCAGETAPGGAVARRPGPERGGVHDALRALHDPHSRAHHAIQHFLAHEVHVPCAPAGGLAAIKAAGPSIWVCAFTRSEWLADYRRELSPQWAAGSHLTLGADLVRIATRTSDPAGILLNPHAGEPATITGMLSIPPALTARIGKTLRPQETPLAGMDEPTDRFPLPSGTWPR